jgi:hypothetical protein
MKLVCWYSKLQPGEEAAKKKIKARTLVINVSRLLAQCLQREMVVGLEVIDLAFTCLMR